MLGQFGKSVKKPRMAYQTFALDGLAEKHRPEFYGGAEDLRILEGDTFIQFTMRLPKTIFVMNTKKFEQDFPVNY
jgi:hypothetical protein